MQATRTAVVKAPAQIVWSVVSDHEGMAAWGLGWHVTLLRRGADDRNGVGALRKVKQAVPAPAIVEEIVAFEPPHRMAYRAVSGVPLRNYRGEIRLRPVSDGTEITYTISADRRVPLLDGLAVGLICRTLLAALVRQIK